MRRRLLCAVDLTERSDEAMRRTALLAKQLNAHVMFMHAVDDSHSGRVIRMKVNRAYVRLHALSERVMRGASADTIVSVRLGKPLDAIAETARDWTPDLIVMAAPRRRRLDLILGNTAERVIRNTDCPVLVVRRPALSAYNGVVLATDLSITAEHTARTAGDVGVLENGIACVVHAFGAPNQPSAATAPDRRDVVAAHEAQWSTTIYRDLCRSLLAAGIDPSGTRLAVEPTHAVDAIRNALDRERPELLVIGVSRAFILKRLVYGTVAEQVLKDSHCDVFAVPPPPRRLMQWLRAA